MQYHRRGQGVPLLVAATMRTNRTLGIAVAPRLDSTKKLRSSRRYFPSLPDPASEDSFNMELDNNVEDDEIESMGVRNDAVMGVWSGRHHRAAEDEDGESQGGEESEDADEDEEGCDTDHEEYWSDDGNDTNDFVGLSARDKLGDDFARDAIANGKSSPPRHPNHLLTDFFQQGS
jgi:hypothetical protein